MGIQSENFAVAPACHAPCLMQDIILGATASFLTPPPTRQSKLREIETFLGVTPLFLVPPPMCQSRLREAEADLGGTTLFLFSPPAAPSCGQHGQNHVGTRTQ